MKPKIGTDAIVLVVFLILFAVVSLQIAGRDTSGDEGPRPRRSTFSPKPGGWKAAYLLLEQSGIKTRRWEKPPSTWPDSVSAVIAGQEVLAVEGGAYWTADQAKDAMGWVERGGTLLLFAAENNAVTQEVGVSPDLHKNKDNEVHPTQPAPYLNGVRGVVIPGAERFLALGKDATVLLADDKPAVVAVKRGSGRVLLVSSPAVIDNRTLSKAENARFLVQAVSAFLQPARKDGVLWDEFHQGYQEERSFWNAIGQPGQFALLQLGVLIALISYTMGTRFGLPRPAPPQDRLSSEYVSSLADLYRRAKASDAALEGVYLSFWRDLCRAVGMPLDSEAAEVARLAAASLGSDSYGANAGEKRAKRETRITRLLQECETRIEAGAKKLPDNELLTLARAIEDMRKELELGRDERKD
ncbi:MAG: DUF4350 domain-containing protein [Akkermansiaceae bacterium]|nr:DUF4350 domain-containing protein [Armatimonadota bacterium]